MKKVKVVLLILLCVIVTGCVLFFGKNSRAGVESPPYTVVKAEGDCELRTYAALKLVSTPARGSSKDGSFMTLFRYITGANASGEKIEMTTPVIMDRGENTGSMSFIVPAATMAKGAPAPKSEKVQLRDFPGGKIAVHRFRGRDAAETEAAAKTKLQAWVKAQGLQPKGEALFAYYDPPWTPTALRRNEVMQRVE
jgi:DNA gyrase inhibitor GyrI